MDFSINKTNIVLFHLICVLNSYKYNIKLYLRQSYIILKFNTFYSNLKF